LRRQEEKRRCWLEGLKSWQRRPSLGRCPRTPCSTTSLASDRCEKPFCDACVGHRRVCASRGEAGWRRGRPIRQCRQTSHSRPDRPSLQTFRAMPSWTRRRCRGSRRWLLETQRDQSGTGHEVPRLPKSGRQKQMVGGDPCGWWVVPHQPTPSRLQLPPHAPTISKNAGSSS
jgi:hypothetical protein